MPIDMRKLEGEFDLWGEAGRSATLWWRDDDAGASRPELEMLLELTQALRIPLHMAVIPAVARADWLSNVKDLSLVRVLQHGWAHANHQPAGHVPSELGDARPREAVLAEIAAGLPRLSALFGAERFLYVLVPPWGSISPRVSAHLGSIGIRGVSGLGPRKSVLMAPGVVQINVHADIIKWRSEPGFIGDGRILSQLIGHLRARRLGRVDADEPTGIMTHHWAHDSACWGFLERLGRLVNEHPAAKWTTPDWQAADA